MTRLLLAVALAALITAGWFLAQSSWPRVPQEHRDRTDERVNAAESAAGANRAAAPDSSADATDTGSDLRQPVAPAPLRLTVKVVHRDGAPAATGTEVVAITPTDVTALEWLQLSDTELAVDPEHLLTLESPARAVTDDQGIASLPRPESWTWLVAREIEGATTRYGFERVETGTAEAEIRLVRRSPLRVRVLDQFERPVADVPVQLAGSGLPGVRWGHALSDADGLSRLWGWSELRDRNMRKGGAGPVYAAAVIPAEDPVTVRVPLTHDLDDIVDLHLPPHCEVVVRVVGLGPGLTGKVGLKPWPKMPGDFSIPQYSSPLARLVDGEARFPWVTLDYRFQLWVWFDDYDGELHLRPTSAKRDGERQEIVFDAGEAMLLTGRLVDAAGLPLVGRSSANYLLRGESGSSGRTAMLDDDGRFRILVGSSSIPTTLDELEFTQLVDRKARGKVVHRFPNGFERGRHDLGTLRIESRTEDR